MSVYKRKGENELGEQREEMSKNENIGNIGNMNKVCFVEELIDIKDEKKKNTVEKNGNGDYENSLNVTNGMLYKNEEEITCKEYSEESCGELEKNTNECQKHLKKDSDENHKNESYVEGEFCDDRDDSNLSGDSNDDAEKYENTRECYNMDNGDDNKRHNNVLLVETKNNIQKIKKILLDVQKKRREENDHVNDDKDKLVKLRREYFDNKRAFERSKKYMSTDLQLMNRIILSFEKRVYFDEESGINHRFDKNITRIKNKFCNSFDVINDDINNGFMRRSNKNLMYNICSRIDEGKKMYGNLVKKEENFNQDNKSTNNVRMYKDDLDFVDNRKKEEHYRYIGNCKDGIKKKMINNEMKQKTLQNNKPIFSSYDNINDSLGNKMIGKHKSIGNTCKETIDHTKIRNKYDEREYSEMRNSERRKQYEDMNCKSYSRDLVNYKTNGYMSMNTQMFENDARNFLFVPVISNSNQNEMYSHKDKSKSVDWVQAINEVEEKENNAMRFNGDRKNKYRPYKCTFPGCDKSYTSLYGLKYHKEHGHSKIEDENTKPFKCEAFGCNKRYKNANGLKYHIENGHKF